MTPYQVLGLQPGYSEKELKSAYRRLALRWHPDKQNGDRSRFMEIQEAYHQLETLFQDRATIDAERAEEEASRKRVEELRRQSAAKAERLRQLRVEYDARRARAADAWMPGSQHGSPIARTPQPCCETKAEKPVTSETTDRSPGRCDVGHRGAPPVSVTPTPHVNQDVPRRETNSSPQKSVGSRKRSRQCRAAPSAPDVDVDVDWDPDSERAT